MKTWFDWLKPHLTAGSQKRVLIKSGQCPGTFVFKVLPQALCSSCLYQGPFSVVFSTIQTQLAVHSLGRISLQEEGSQGVTLGPVCLAISGWLNIHTGIPSQSDFLEFCCFDVGSNPGCPGTCLCRPGQPQIHRSHPAFASCILGLILSNTDSVYLSSIILNLLLTYRKPTKTSEVMLLVSNECIKDTYQPNINYQAAQNSPPTKKQKWKQSELLCLCRSRCNILER